MQIDSEDRAKQLLGEIVEFINTETKGAWQLWAILTALRGPDNDKAQLKRDTTVLLRGKIGLKYCLFADALSSPEPLKLKHNRAFPDHFTDHYNDAVIALAEMGLNRDDSKIAAK